MCSSLHDVVYLILLRHVPLNLPLHKIDAQACAVAPEAQHMDAILNQPVRRGEQ